MQPLQCGSGSWQWREVRWRSLVVAPALVVALYTVPPTARHGALAEAQYAQGQISVTLAQGNNIDMFNATHGTSTITALPDGRTYLLDLPATETADDAVTAWSGEPDVATIEPNYAVNLLAADEAYLTFHESYLTFHGTGFPSAAQGQWALSTIEAPAAQQLSTGSGVKVAVLDTGVDTSHPALAPLIAQGGYDYISHTTTISDVVGGPASGHGTFVAGLIAQVAPGAALLPFRVLDSNGVGTVGDVAAAVEVAADEGARIINMSMGMAIPSQTLHEAILYAQQRGAVIVASAGNQDASVEQYPAAWDGVVAVAGTDQYDRHASFSNYGSWISVSAPSVDLVSTYPGGYADGSGTSFAAPLVSGELALVGAAQPASSEDSAAGVEDSSVAIDALNPAYAGLLGAGRIDALRALNAVLSASS
jgi:subtilisin family serine protease